MCAREKDSGTRRGHHVVCSSVQMAHSCLTQATRSWAVGSHRALCDGAAGLGFRVVAVAVAVAGLWWCAGLR